MMTIYEKYKSDRDRYNYYEKKNNLDTMLFSNWLNT